MKHWKETVLSSALAAIVFLNTLPAGFVYDDNRAIVQNDDSRWGSSTEALLFHDFWGTPLHVAGSHGSWRPLTTFTFRVDHLLAGGLHPCVYHATNIVLHALVTGLFTVWCRTVAPRGPAPLVAGLLFAVYPVHCEAVTGLVGRAELGQAVCMLLALLAHRSHIKYRSTSQHNNSRARVYLVLTIALAVAATLFKEQGLVTLAVCATCDVLKHASFREMRLLLTGSSKITPKLRDLRSSLRTMATMSALLLCTRIAIAGGGLPRFAVADNPAAHESSFVTRTLTFLYLPAFSAKLALLPVTLSFDWSMDAVPHVQHWRDHRNVMSCILYSMIALLAWRRQKTVLFGLVVLVLPYLPVSNLAGYVGFVAAERVLYTPSLGLCFLVGLGFTRLWERGARPVLATGLVFLLAVLSARTFRRNLDWQSEETLYRSGLSVNPPKAYGNLGSILASQGRMKEAEKYYRTALSYRPNMADVHYNLGLLLLQVGGPTRLHEAEYSLRAAIAYRPKLAAAHVALGVALARKGAVLEAETALAYAAKLDGAGQRDQRAHQSARASALLHLGRLQLESHRTSVAVETLLRATDAMPPGYHQPQSVYNLLGEAYSRLGRQDKAESWIRASLAARPDHIPAQLSLARLLATNESRAAEAEGWLSRALKIAPGDASVLRNYGEFLLRRGRHVQAAEMLERVLKVTSFRYSDVVNAATAHRLAGQLDVAERLYTRARDLKPQEASSHGNLGACQHLAGRLHEAEANYRRALALKPGDSVTSNNLQRLKRLLDANAYSGK